MLLRHVRAPGASTPVCLSLRDGMIAAIAPDLFADGEDVVDAGGALAIPGLWDHHVHGGQTRLPGPSPPVRRSPGTRWSASGTGSWT